MDMMPVLPMWAKLLRYEKHETVRLYLFELYNRFYENELKRVFVINIH
jgi:hypothetical protein